MTNLQENELDKIILGVRNYYAGLRSSENLPIPCMTDLEAQAAIAELVDRCIGPDDEIPYDEGGRFHFKVLARNELRKEIRNNLKQKGLL